MPNDPSVIPEAVSRAARTGANSTNRSQDDSRVSIIIATYNECNNLPACIDSILMQDYGCKEIIVIDGGSCDGTVDIIRSYGTQISNWTSEPDQGIYHAWNKGLQVASGNWICFLGADDRWSAQDSLSEMMRLTQGVGVNFVSAQVRRLSGPNGYEKIFGNEWSMPGMARGMIVAHAGTLHHRSLFVMHGLFNQAYRIVGDYEFLLRSAPSIVARYLPKETVVMGGNGVSATDLRTVCAEGYSAIKKDRSVGGLRPATIFLVRFWVRFGWKMIWQSAR